MEKTFREWRKEKGLTSSYVADKLGISVYTLNAKERGDSNFNLRQRKALCDLYDIKISDCIFLDKSTTKME